MMSSYFVPNDMTPEQRRSEIAAILARGYLRLRSARKHCAVNREEALDAVADKSVYAPAKTDKQ